MNKPVFVVLATQQFPDRLRVTDYCKKTLNFAPYFDESKSVVLLFGSSPNTYKQTNKRFRNLSANSARFWPTLWQSNPKTKVSQTRLSQIRNINQAKNFLCGTRLEVTVRVFISPWFDCCHSLHSGLSQKAICPLWVRISGILTPLQDWVYSLMTS